MRVLGLAEPGFEVLLGPVGVDDLLEGPGVVVGDQDPFTEDLGLQPGLGGGVDPPGQPQRGGGVPVSSVVMTRASQRGAQMVSVSACTFAGGRRVRPRASRAAGSVPSLSS